MLAAVIVGVVTFTLIVGLHLAARFYHKSHLKAQDKMDAFFFGSSRYNFRQVGDIWQVVDQHRSDTVIETHDCKESARTSAAKLNLVSELGEAAENTTDEGVSRGNN